MSEYICQYNNKTEEIVNEAKPVSSSRQTPELNKLDESMKRLGKEKLIKIAKRLNIKLTTKPTLKNPNYIKERKNQIIAKIIEKAKNYFDENQIIITNVDKKAYLSSLKLADHIVVTCDSTSMISEAAMTGKPIYVAQMPAVKKNIRFKKFFELFKSLDIIKNLEDTVEEWNYKKLNETDRISGYIEKQFKNYDFS